MDIIYQIPEWLLFLVIIIVFIFVYKIGTGFISFLMHIADRQQFQNDCADLRMMSSEVDELRGELQRFFND